MNIKILNKCHWGWFFTCTPRRARVETVSFKAANEACAAISKAPAPGTTQPTPNR